MKAFCKRAALLVIFALLLVGTTLPAFAAGSEFSTDVYLKSGVKITQVSLDVVIPVGGSTTLSVIAQGGGPTYSWEVSTDGGTN